MSALFLISTDTFYYENIHDIDLFNTKAQMNDFLNKNAKILISPSHKEILENIANEDIYFLDYKFPDDERLKDLLVIKELPSVHRNRTSQELKYNVSLRDSLKQKLQLEVIETSNNYEKLAGAVEMKSFFKQVVTAFDKGKVKKITIFLLGIPGAGKTYLAECVAGEFGFLLVKFNLSLIMYMPNPIKKLHEFFRYIEELASKGEYVVALLDEIAKAISGGTAIQEQFMGELLTILEDLNSSRGYQVKKSMFIATENNISIILDSKPEFMRRWIESYFIDFPKENEAKMMLKMYLDNYSVVIGENNSEEDIEGVYLTISRYWANAKVRDDLEDDRFIYSPSEIEKFCSKLSIYSEGVERIDNDLIRKVCGLTPAQQDMLKMGIQKMINDANKGFVRI